MYTSIHQRLFGSATADRLRESNDAALVSAVLLTAAALDSSPPTTKQGVEDRLADAIGESYALSAIRREFNQLS